MIIIITVVLSGSQKTNLADFPTPILTARVYICMYVVYFKLLLNIQLSQISSSLSRESKSREIIRRKKRRGKEDEKKENRKITLWNESPS